MLEMFRRAGVPRRKPPPMEPNSNSLESPDHATAPKILSPQPSLVYTLQASATDRRRVPLRADASPGVSRLFWFADSRFLGSTPPTTPLMWQADAGNWRIHVLDDQGRSSAMKVRVEMVP